MSGHLVAAYHHEVPVLQGLFGALSQVTPLRSVEPAWRLRPGDCRRPDLCLPTTGLGQLLRGRQLTRLFQGAGGFIGTRPDQIRWQRQTGAMPFWYHVADDYRTYNRDWEAADLALLRQARQVFAVSRALAHSLCERAGLPPERVTVLPNAVARSHLPAQVPAARPLDGRRPVAGVLGRVSSRLRLDWLGHVVEHTPWLDWVFGGDVERGELLPQDRPALDHLMHHPRCRFTGRLGYTALEAMAKTLDVAVLPYSGRSTNPLGSPVRLFVHLPLGAPILATPGCLQLEEFTPLVTMCREPQGMVQRLEWLRARGFDDGLREQRWITAHHHTWDVRASTMLAALGR